MPPPQESGPKPPNFNQAPRVESNEHENDRHKAIDFLNLIADVLHDSEPIPDDGARMSDAPHQHYISITSDVRAQEGMRIMPFEKMYHDEVEETLASLVKKLNNILREARDVTITRHTIPDAPNGPYELAFEVDLPFFVPFDEDWQYSKPRRQASQKFFFDILIRPEGKQDPLSHVAVLSSVYALKPHIAYEEVRYAENDANAILPSDDLLREKTGFETWEQQHTTKEILKHREHIYSALLKNYAEMFAGIEKEGATLRTLQKAQNLYHAEKVQYLLPHIATDMRRALFPLRNEHPNDVMRDLTHELTENDARRWRMHRFIERFAYVYRCGTSAGIVRNDLLLEMQKETEQVRPVGNLLHARIKKEFEGDKNKNKLVITTGTGGGYTAVSYDSLIPAKDPSYESYLGKGRTNDNDRELMDAVMNDLSTTYPFVWRNDVYVTGSFHERFQSFDVVINMEDIIRYAEKMHRFPEEMIEEFLDAFGKAVETRLAEQKHQTKT